MCKVITTIWILTIASPFTSELKVDQSIAHNGVCLTVTSFMAINTKSQRSMKHSNGPNLGSLKKRNKINLERCAMLGARLDGHIVQGHVDTVAGVTKIEEQNGSWLFYFGFKSGAGYVTVKKDPSV